MINKFAGSDAGAERAAAIYTLVQTAKLNNINSEIYLRDILAKIANGHTINRISELMLWHDAVRSRYMPLDQPPGQLALGPEFGAAPRHRLLFAIWPDAGAIDRLTKTTAGLAQDKTMPGRPVDPDRLHVTLHRLGDFVDQIPPSLVPAASLAAATVRMQPFEVAFDRIGGTRGHFLLRASDRLEMLMEFRQTLSAALIKAGLRRCVNPVFNPHITLSYDDSDVPEQKIEPISWTVSLFTLTESLLGKHMHIERGRWQIQP